jgi:hypothetical protein
LVTLTLAVLQGIVVIVAMAIVILVEVDVAHDDNDTNVLASLENEPTRIIL